MRMHLVEVLEGRWQFRQYRLRVTQVHAGHVVTFEGVHETLGRCGFHKKTELHNKTLNSGGSPQHISFPH